MKPARSGWIVSATLRKSQLALERSGPGAGIQMVQAQNVVIADNFMDAIMTFLGTVGKENFVVALSVQNLPVVEAETKEEKEKAKKFAEEKKDEPDPASRTVAI